MSETTVQTVRKPFKYKLCPTPEQERVLDRTVMLCRHLYHAGLDERREAWRLGGIAVSRFQQEAQLKDIGAELPEYADLHRHVLQAVLAGLDRAFQACFRRVQAGEKPGYPRFKGRNFFHSRTDNE